MLKNGPQTVTHIAAETDESTDAVNKALRRAEGKVFVKAPTPEGVLRWANLYQENAQTA